MDCNPVGTNIQVPAGVISVSSGCAGTSAFETLMFVSDHAAVSSHGTGSLVCVIHPGINPV